MPAISKNFASAIFRWRTCSARCTRTCCGRCGRRRRPWRWRSAPSPRIRCASPSPHGRPRSYTALTPCCAAWTGSGPARISLDASHELTLAWPGGSRVPVLVLRGYALCGPRTAGAHESLELGVGSVLWVRTGSLVLLPHGPAQELLDAAAAAGYAVSPLVSECLPPGPSAGCRLQAGDFVLDEIRLVAQLNGRSVP